MQLLNIRLGRVHARPARAPSADVINAGGGFQNYPDDYAISRVLHADGELTLRIAYNLFTQRAGEELEDFSR